MKRLTSFFLFLLYAFIINAQQSDFAQMEQQAEAERRAHYKEVVTQIFKNDELFVLFYLNLALVVDPTRDTQIVEPITTDNPWESLTEYINGKSNIYFCPSGRQLSIAIEYKPCPIDPDILMSDRYGMYRLSSPEELFKNRGDSFSNTKHKAVVFGGLKYDEESKPMNDNLLAFRGNREAIEGYRYLESTYEEAVYIDSIFRRNGIETALLTGEDGTEKCFAQIPNHQVDILHIASHGFYEPDKDNTESSSLQEWMMSHAGLVLSGAENESVDRANDGRLTAYEISQTDLSGVNLVVLSACDTGLGDIKDNDVYGLLKGFKKAGAGSLLVTLSQVNDTVTSLLMKRFYDNIFRGDNPRRALENAQRYIRLHGNGQFNKPEYWAAFILVDDLDRNIGTGISEKNKDIFLSEILRSEDIYSENSMFPNWDLVRSNLKGGDIVLRIFPYQRQGVIEYVALFGNVANGHCQIVRMFKTEDVSSKIIEWQEYTSEHVFDKINNLLWNHILPIIKSSKRIFVQPAGLFNDLPFESSPLVTNKYLIYRISSLESLLSRKRINITNAALFGGLDYDSGQDRQLEGDVQGSITRGISISFSYLHGTRREIYDIGDLLLRQGIDVSIYEHETGTESELKKLSGSPVQILHLATHAYGIDDSVAITRGKLHHWKLRRKISIPDYLLCFSGLALSGANKSLGEEQENIFNKGNNGIITGEEISHLNFSQVDLITLSACNTATNHQRYSFLDVPWNLIKSFKFAGVHSFLASLWNVDDHATCMLMAEFYKNWIGKMMTKHDALEAAKQTVRSHKKKGWDDPKYWAAFILLDGLD